MFLAVAWDFYAYSFKPIIKKTCCWDFCSCCYTKNIRANANPPHPTVEMKSKTPLSLKHAVEVFAPQPATAAAMVVAPKHRSKLWQSLHDKIGKFAT